MKIKIDPSKLKPGQLFDARGIFTGATIYDDHTFQEIIYGPKGEQAVSSETEVIPVADYEFFTEVTHPQLVAALCKPGADILASLTPEKCHLDHMAHGIAGEAGELVDAIKKHTVYNKPLDRENVIEELGDLEWYCEGLRASLGITREEVLEANIVKLAKRYAGLSYSDKAAQDRADKVPAEVGITPSKDTVQITSSRPMSDREWSALPAGDREKH